MPEQPVEAAVHPAPGKPSVIKRLLAGAMLILSLSFWAMWLIWRIDDTIQLPGWMDTVMTLLFMASPILAIISIVVWLLPGRSWTALVAAAMNIAIALVFFAKMSG
jgi:hypothetical protein